MRCSLYDLGFDLDYRDDDEIENMTVLSWSKKIKDDHILYAREIRNGDAYVITMTCPITDHSAAQVTFGSEDEFTSMSVFDWKESSCKVESSDRLTSIADVLNEFDSLIG